ncbi:hypothetical protein [Streptomyces sporangiiformans]|uniref:hypothetical protein n=1 Tax=Streptomyces sporangiiformans TaxID=2315329 RepID=UPI0013C465D9
MEAKWARGDNTQHLSSVPFPAEELALYARQAFAQLKEEQSSLLGRRRKQGSAQPDNGAESVRWSRVEPRPSDIHS